MWDLWLTGNYQAAIVVADESGVFSALDKRPATATTASFSMLMLLATQGQQFTFGELKQILESAGFTRIESRQMRLLPCYHWVQGRLT